MRLLLDEHGLEWDEAWAEVEHWRTLAEALGAANVRAEAAEAAEGWAELVAFAESAAVNRHVDALAAAQPLAA